MSELIAFCLLIVLGYVLGIVGFFRAGTAIYEVRALRRLLEEERAQRPEMRVDPSPPVGQPSAAPPMPDLKPTTDASSPAGPAPRPKPGTPPSPPSPPAAPADSGPPPRPVAQPDLESVLTMRWAAWIGAVALFLAGVFLVRYAAEQGLLGPATRCAAAAVLGLALLAAADWMQRREPPAIDGPFRVDQAPPALAAGGVAVLFGAAYGAGPFYDMLPSTIAFALMAAASFIGMAAALRFGPLTAAVGIVGAFVAPALVQTQAPSLVALFAYLALATAAAYEVVWRTAWTWLGFAVAIAGAVWIVVASAAGPHDSQLWAVAVYVPLAAFFGVLLPDAAVGDTTGRVLAFGQLAILAGAGLALESAAPGSATRLALFALTPIAVWKALDAPPLDRLPWISALAGLGVLALWLGGTGVSLPEIDAWSSALPAAVIFAAAYAAVGLRFESRAPGGVRWSALLAVPVLTLALCYARVGRFQSSPSWGLAGLLLAIALTGAARRAAVHEAQASAGAHAAGAVAALALAFAMTLRDRWLIDALALMLPGLAWVELRVPLPTLRKLALVVAGVVLVLVWHWLTLDFDLLLWLSRSAHPFEAYAVPAVAFFAASHLFRARDDDATVATLEAGAMGLAALYVTLQISVWFGHGRFDADYGFDETATLMLAMAAQALAYDRIWARAPRMTVQVACTGLACIALAIATGLLFDNPMVSDARVSALSLLLAYAAPGCLSAVASLLPRPEPRMTKLLGGYAIIAGLAWVTLQVRHAFHPVAMGLDASGVDDAELWAWSGAWLLYSLALIGLGIRLRHRALRMVALALIGLVSAKVFLWDMAGLTGLWRVASFLGLGLTLIGLGAAHRRFVLPLQAQRAA